MASRKILNKTCVLFNYLGEVNDIATYQEARIGNCYYSLSTGTSLSRQGREGNDSTRIYLFDSGTSVRNIAGNIMTFAPPDSWMKLDDKSDFWTIRFDGNDYVMVDGQRLRIVQAKYYRNGTRKMWHWEVDCQ